jgi:glycosyltransferase involved in cell wall biosynthesis
MPRNEWHLITSEYPPMPGGVSDYSQTLAKCLAMSGDTVHVWCPLSEAEIEDVENVLVHRELGEIAPWDLHRCNRMLDKFPAPRRLLVQWVPHGYRYHSMNIPFALWVWQRAALHGDAVELMVHEPFLVFGESLKQHMAATVQRIMIMVLLHAARQVWVAIPAWEALCRRYAFGRHARFRWLPVPSNIAFVKDPKGITAIRRHYSNGQSRLLGYFGTYDRLRNKMLMAILPRLLENPEIAFLLIGRGSDLMRTAFLESYSTFGSRLHATGSLENADVSRHISACDLMMQPYPDGVSSRRTSVMAALSHGRPTVTTTGPLTEPLWKESGAVALAPGIDVDGIVECTQRLLLNHTERARLSAAAEWFYLKHFDAVVTVGMLRDTCEP